MLSQPVVTNRSVESFNVSVLLGLSGLNIFQIDSAFFCPVHHCTADVFRAVVHDDGFGLASPFNDLVQGEYHALRSQGEINLDGQCFPIEIVDHVEQANALGLIRKFNSSSR